MVKLYRDGGLLPLTKMTVNIKIVGWTGVKN